MSEEMKEEKETEKVEETETSETQQEPEAPESTEEKPEEKEKEDESEKILNAFRSVVAEMIPSIIEGVISGMNAMNNRTSNSEGIEGERNRVSDILKYSNAVSMDTIRDYVANGKHVTDLALKVLEERNAEMQNRIDNIRNCRDYESVSSVSEMGNRQKKVSGKCNKEDVANAFRKITGLR